MMNRSGCASGTRTVATKLWRGRLPARPLEQLVRELYETENKGKAERSGSQDMIGLIYPGINRLDYDFTANGGVFPSHIESLNNARVARWLERVLHVLPMETGGPRVTIRWVKSISTRSGSRAWAGRARIALTPFAGWTLKRWARP